MQEVMCFYMSIITSSISQNSLAFLTTSTELQLRYQHLFDEHQCWGHTQWNGSYASKVPLGLTLMPENGLTSAKSGLVFV